ncbi:DUF1569 domain-containing protein [Flavobacterium marginilacus]|uniref:DUF1569 domain-containing protein n=1 Tax=Flavobacterium marginilacus TaxID=3003256 RepID=UPI00248E7BD5|nr:DUF1569 domain-containing protein [Flavobacterium marginilacus]
MNSIFDKIDNQSIIDRINTLNPETAPLWGKMSVDQMLKHTNEVIIVAFGERNIKVNFFIRLLGKMSKKSTFNFGFNKNSPTAKEFIFTGKYDFEQAKSELIKNFSRFTEKPVPITIMDHPFWGKMTYKDWNKLMWKHIDHHLTQFGV